MRYNVGAVLSIGIDLMPISVPNSTLHFDADPDPILSFTHVGKSDFYIVFFIFLSLLSASWVSKRSIFFTVFKLSGKVPVVWFTFC